jgi:hypothetical protein
MLVRGAYRLLVNICRDLLNMNPPVGSKSVKGKKRGVTICPRVLTFAKKLFAFKGSQGKNRESICYSSESSVILQ